MCLPYLAPVGSKWAAKQSVEVVEKFKTDVLMFSETGFLIICGDLNARTDVLNDYLSEEEVLTNEWLNSLNFDQEYNTLNKLKLPKRSSQDKGGLSGHGKALLELCKATNLKIVNGRAFQDKNIGKFTFHESRGSSVVDYLLADVKVWDLLENFAVHDVSCKSDHCPIEFSICTEENISLNRDASVETMNVDCGDDSFKLIKSEKTDELVSSMVNDAKLSENLIELDKNLKEGIISPNNALSVLEQKLLNITEHSMKKIKTNTINKNNITSVKEKNDNSKPWYNQECKEAKKIMRKARKQFSYALKNFPSTSQIVQKKEQFFVKGEGNTIV